MKKRIIITGIVSISLLCLYSSLIIVTEGFMGIITSFGKPLKVLEKPGLYIKLPAPVNSIEFFDGRLQILEPAASEFLTADKKNLIVQNTICYKIKDPILLMKTVRNSTGALTRLTDLLTSHTGTLLGMRELSDIINTNQEKIKYDEINNSLMCQMKEESSQFGIDIEKVFIKHIMLPKENQAAIYDRMKAERSRIAKKYLAEGEEQALKIKAEADRQARTIVSEAEKKSSIIKGEADARAMSIYGKTYSRNSGFYNYMKAMEVYGKVFNKNTVIILDEKSPILKNMFQGSVQN